MEEKERAFESNVMMVAKATISPEDEDTRSCILLMFCIQC